MSRRRVERLNIVLFIGIVTLTVLDRAWMVHTTMGYASDDLTVIWLASTDYARGLFLEPFFYGQDYGVMLEALFAAPFVALGADPVKTISSMIGLFAIAPYLAFAFHHCAQRNWWAACLFAAIPLLLPVEHGLQITALNGIAVLALVPLALRKDPGTGHHVLLSLILSVAVFVNPNALLLALPIGLEHLIRHGRSLRTWCSMALGLAPALLLWSLARDFFTNQSVKVVHTLFDWRMHFKPSLIPSAFTNLDAHFAWTAPLCGDHASVGVLLVLVGAALLFLQRSRSAGWAAVSALLLITFSFSFAKTHDGTGSIFFPLSRSFLAMPLLLAWVWSLVELRSKVMHFGPLLLFVFAMIHSGSRMVHAKTVFASALEQQEQDPTRTLPVAVIKARCDQVVDLAAKAQAERIVLLRGNDPFRIQFLTYTIPVFHPQAPMTWMVGHDRRTFQRSLTPQTTVERVLFIGGDRTDIARIIALGGRASIVQASAPLAIVCYMPARSTNELIDAMQ